MREKWRSLVQDQRERNRLNMNYDHLIKFVDREVRIAADPVYGKAAMERETSGYAMGSGDVGQRNRGRVTVNAVSLEKGDCGSNMGKNIQEHSVAGNDEKFPVDDIRCLH